MTLRVTTENTDAVTRRIDEDAAAMANELTAELYLEMLSYSFSETEPDAILADLKVQTKQEFPELPECSCTIKAVPEALELSLSPAFYLTPPMDRFQDNVIYINGSEEYADTPLYISFDGDGSTLAVGQNVNKHIALDDDGSTAHKGTYIVTCIAGHAEDTTGHTAPVAAVCTADVVLRTAVYRKFSTSHCNTSEGVNVTVYGNLAALHPAAGVHIGVAVDHNLTSSHLLADTLYTSPVAVQDDLGLSCSTSPN